MGDPARDDQTNVREIEDYLLESLRDLESLAASVAALQDHTRLRLHALRAATDPELVDDTREAETRIAAGNGFDDAVPFEDFESRWEQATKERSAAQ